MQEAKKCPKHDKGYTQMCLAEGCKAELFLCDECKDFQSHKHSKTDIVNIGSMKTKLSSAWEPKDSRIDPYFKRVDAFYESIHKQVQKLIDEDHKSVLNYLIKAKYYHLPLGTNSLAYLQFMKADYENLDRRTLLKLINQADSGELNKNLGKQKEITDLLDLELKKVNDKVLTLKYVLLSKKLEAQLLTPSLSEESKVAYPEDFVKICSILNSRGMLMRSAKLTYRASQKSNFYNQCNGVLNCLTIVKTKNNKLVGGFTPLPLVHHDSDQLEQPVFEPDLTQMSFIFSISNLKTFSLKDPSKAVLYSKDQKGPQFGQDLHIDEFVSSNIGHSYESAGVAVDSLEAKVYLLDIGKAEIRDYEVWQLSF